VHARQSSRYSFNSRPLYKNQYYYPPPPLIAHTIAYRKNQAEYVIHIRVAADPLRALLIVCGRCSWGFGVFFLSCVCVRVSVSGVLFSVGVCVCDLLICTNNNKNHTRYTRRCTQHTSTTHHTYGLNTRHTPPHTHTWDKPLTYKYQTQVKRDI